jgi:phospholipase/carboxylesterase
MNRLSFWADEVKAASPPSSSKNKRRLIKPVSPSVLRRRQAIAGDRRAYFSPLHYEPNYAYPLLVWLPGAGGDQRQIHQVMPHISLRNYAAACVQGTRQSDEQGKPASWRQSAAEILAAEEAVFGAIEVAREKFHIASERIFLAGYADGGTMALRLALKRPESFAAALSLAGRFPQADVTAPGCAPLIRLAAARKLPLFIAQGRDSQDYPVETLCEELKLFHSAGMSVTVRQYPCQDELDSQMLVDMNVWMMEQVTGVSHTPAEAAPSFGSNN